MVKSTNISVPFFTPEILETFTRKAQAAELADIDKMTFNQMKKFPNLLGSKVKHLMWVYEPSITFKGIK